MKTTCLPPYLILACLSQLAASLIYLLSVQQVQLFIFSGYALILSWLFFQAQKKQTWKKLLLLTTALALEFVLLLQTLGYTIFSGLVKDVAFFSIENILNMLKLSIVMFSLYTGWLLTIRFFSRLLGARRD